MADVGWRGELASAYSTAAGQTVGGAMLVVDAETGEEVVLYPTEQYRADMAALSAKKACNHERTEIRRRTIKGGSVQVVQQCLRCGHPATSPLKKSAGSDTAPPWDEQLQQKFQLWYENAIEAIRQKHVRLQRIGDAKYWEMYDAYLKSDEWKAKRAKVIERADGMCEGCSERPATQVHHLTYKRLFNEMLFDLVAICDECHKVCHPSEE